MPKLKTKSGAAKRFRKTAKGYKHRSANRNHMLTKRAPKVKRQARGFDEIAAVDVPRLRQMLPSKSR